MNSRVCRRVVVVRVMVTQCCLPHYRQRDWLYRATGSDVAVSRVSREESKCLYKRGCKISEREDRAGGDLVAVVSCYMFL
jgi:hypothetical protein